MWAASAIYCVRGKIQIPHVGLAYFLLKMRETLFLNYITNPRYSQSSLNHCYCLLNTACLFISVYCNHCQVSLCQYCFYLQVWLYGHWHTHKCSERQTQLWQVLLKATENFYIKAYCYLPTILPNKGALTHLPRKQTLSLPKIHTPCCFSLFLGGEQLFQTLPETIFPVDILNCWEPTWHPLQSSNRCFKARRLVKMWSILRLRLYLQRSLKYQGLEPLYKIHTGMSKILWSVAIIPLICLEVLLPVLRARNKCLAIKIIVLLSNICCCHR